MTLVSNNYFTYTIGAQLVIIIGTGDGLIAIDFYAHSIMFVIQGISSIEKNTAVLNAVLIQNTYFVYLKSDELMVILDRGIAKDYINIVKLNEEIDGYSPNAKWTIFYYKESYIYIRSDPDGIKIYNLTISSPIFTTNEGIPSATYNITAENFINESCVNSVAITDTDNLYRIVTCITGACDVGNNKVIQVIFKGLRETIFFNPYNYFFGWNMEFNANFEEDSDVYKLIIRDYKKFSHDSTIELDQLYYQVLPMDGYIFMQNNETIYFFEPDFETLIRSTTIKDIIQIEFYNNLVYVLHGNSFRSISVNSPQDNFNFLVDEYCNLIAFCGDFLACGGWNTIFFYNCSTFNCSLVSEQNYKMKITKLASTSNTTQNYCDL
ncbi:hypothetical protein SteCoe_15293 [Stentor coeruleus]|uniref:Uncharacterized protein n=1 Tax=Stentor coeruleus TaxID=5963 RepID=A0A1R2C446_9CILI|nr:hypothetical protein SteCoe_15293 [Stentor coeruleus]